SFCRETRSPRVRTLPDGRGSDAKSCTIKKSCTINETNRSPDPQGGGLLRRTPVSRQKLFNVAALLIGCFVVAGFSLPASPGQEGHPASTNWTAAAPIDRAAARTDRNSMLAHEQ